MRGSQSRGLIEIRDQLLLGVNISHVLNVKVSNKPALREYADAIRRELKTRIWNVQYTLDVIHNGHVLPNVSITWTMNDVGVMSAYYFAVHLPYIDEVIGNHTRLMLSHVCTSIRVLHPEYGNNWGLAYLVTKPLALFQAMPQLDVIIPQIVQKMAIEIDGDGGEDE